MSRRSIALETLRCIYCQSTVRWPVAALYPGKCIHCGRSPAYTCEAPQPLGGEHAEQAAS